MDVEGDAWTVLQDAPRALRARRGLCAVIANREPLWRNRRFCLCNTRSGGRAEARLEG